MTWVANLLVLIGLVLVGRKKSYAFAFTLVGEGIWCYVGVVKEMYDLDSICAVFAIVAAWNWYLWVTYNDERK